MFRLESLNEYKVVLEHTRAEANEDLIDTLHEYEMEELHASIECNAIGRSCAEILMMCFLKQTTASRRLKNKLKNCTRRWNASTHDANQKRRNDALSTKLAGPKRYSLR